MARSKTAEVLWSIVDDCGGDRAKVYTAARISESILGRGLNDRQPIGDKMIERIAIAFPDRAKDLLEAWRVDRARQAAAKAVSVAKELGITLAPQSIATDAAVIDPALAEASSNAMLWITSLATEYPAIAVPLLSRARALVRVERGELDAVGQAQG